MENTTEVRRQTLALLVDNEPGVLSQIARLFSRKGYNIEGIMAAHEEQIGRAIRIDRNRTSDYCQVINHRFLDRLNNVILNE